MFSWIVAALGFITRKTKPAGLKGEHRCLDARKDRVGGLRDLRHCPQRFFGHQWPELLVARTLYTSSAARSTPIDSNKPYIVISHIGQESRCIFEESIYIPMRYLASICKSIPITTIAIFTSLIELHYEIKDPN